MKDFVLPADVPKNKHQTYKDNYTAITHNTDRLFLFSCDQKIEHLNKDFYSSDIHPDAMEPEHLFKIASQGRIGAMATHLGLIARYGNKYPDINYIVKLNAKTNLVKTEQKDPQSAPLWDVHQAIELHEQTGLHIRGIGLTLYIGSEFEDEMLTNAAQEMYEAHQHGLVTILWVYPRGKAVTDEQDPAIVAGATGVAASLGTGFVKVKPPHSTQEKTSAEHLQVATAAAGNTKVLCSGGPKKEPAEFLQELHDQIHIGGSSGNATGRNIFQHSLPRALAMTKAISAIVYDDANVETALKLLK